MAIELRNKNSVTRLAIALMVGFLIQLPQVVRADEAADRVLHGARYASTLQNQDLHGVMRKKGIETPITLFLRGENIQFSYETPTGNKRFHTRLKEGEFELFDIIDGKTTRFSKEKIAQKINGTDLSFEDLSMRFLYWKNSQLVGEEKISGQKCFKVRLINPDESGDYRIVYAWVHKKYGSLMRVIGYNKLGKPLKKFQVTDLMKVGKDYTLKRMRVDSYDSNTNKSIGVTHLEFEKPERTPAPGR